MKAPDIERRPRHPSNPDGASSGLMDLDAAIAWRAALREDGLRLVMTNGCFDLLHVGHLRYLRAARALGDRLIIALNDDASTRGLKGVGRPILPLAERAELLLALDAVDAVMAFGTATAVDPVRRLRPDVYVKGGDYDAASRRPPEADAAEEAGGAVVFLPFVAGRSTTGLIERIRELGR
jgi:rfaE bifunctional protein nucleotidyltransferase chain/domain